MIAGLDPGMTVGWAVLDRKGNLIRKGSSRGFGGSDVIRALVGASRIVVVGSDKAKTPSLVQDVAAKMGAKSLCPQKDLSVDEKRELVSERVENAHERDAIACARFAWRKVAPLIRRVEKAVPDELVERVFELVIKEGISIQAAHMLLSPKPIKAEPVSIEEKEQNKDIAQLYRLLSDARKDNAAKTARAEYFEKECARLQRKIAGLYERMQGLVRPTSKKERFALKERQVHALEERAKAAQEKLRTVQSQLQALEAYMLDERFVAVPRFETLGKQCIGKKVGSIIFVDDTTKQSVQAIEWLRAQEVELVLCKVAARKLPFACVTCTSIIGDAIALIRKDELSKIRASRVVLSKIIEEYHKERSIVRE